MVAIGCDDELFVVEDEGFRSKEKDDAAVVAEYTDGEDDCMVG